MKVPIVLNHLGLENTKNALLLDKIVEEVALASKK